MGGDPREQTAPAEQPGEARSPPSARNPRAELQLLPEEQLLAMNAVSAVLPFRTNPYVVEELIRWEQVPDDPIFQLTFPQPGMLEQKDYERMLDLVRGQAPGRDRSRGT